MQIKQFKPSSHKIKAVVYGASGSGKTSFAGTAKNAVFASAEGGLLSIASKSPNYTEIKSLQDLKDFYLYLKSTPHAFETVIIDSITEINDIIKADIEKKTGKPMQLQDWGTLSKEIRNIFRSFRDLPMHVLFIAQETADDKDENGTASKIVPSLNGKASTEIAYFMDVVGYVYIAKDGTHRVITGSNPRLLTKDRTGLIGNDTPADFQAWVDKVASLEVGAETVTASYENPANVAPATPAQPVAPTTPAQPAPVAPAQEIGSSTAKVTQPVQTKLYDMAKGGLAKVTSLAQAQNGLAKVKTVAGLTDEQRAELVDAYEAKVVQFTPSTGDTTLPIIN